MRYSLGACTIDTDAYEIRRGGEPVAVEPQVFDLLVLLLRNRGRLVTKDEIFQRIWNGRSVSDAALSSRVRSMREAIGDSGASQAFIRTVRRRGFRLIGAVAENGDDPAQDIPFSDVASMVPLVDSPALLRYFRRAGRRLRRRASAQRDAGSGRPAARRTAARRQSRSPTRRSACRPALASRSCRSPIRPVRRRSTSSAAPSPRRSSPSSPAIPSCAWPRGARPRTTTPRRSTCETSGASLACPFLVTGSLRRSDERVRVTAQHPGGRCDPPVGGNLRALAHPGGSVRGAGGRRQQGGGGDRLDRRGRDRAEDARPGAREAAARAFRLRMHGFARTRSCCPGSRPNRISRPAPPSKPR